MPVSTIVVALNAQLLRSDQARCRRGAISRSRGAEHRPCRIRQGLYSFGTLDMGPIRIDWKAGLMNHRIMSGLSLPIRHSLTLLLGLAAVITGILGMHILNISHGPGSGSLDVTVTTAAAHTASHSSDAEAAVSSHATPPDSAGCTGPCGGEHDLMAAACVLMMVVASFALFFKPNRLRTESRHGLRAPPHPVPWSTSMLRPPSLVQLSISRT